MIANKNVLRLFSLALVVAVVLAVGVSSAFAITDATGDVWASGCSVKYEITVTTFDLPGPPDGFRVGVTDDRSPDLFGGDFDEYTRIYFKPADGGDYTVSGRFFLEPEDRVLRHVFVHDGLPKWGPSFGEPLWRYIGSVDMTNCKDDEIPNWWFSVEDMGATTNYSYDGTLACGVFDVQGWGAKTVDLLDYPNCTGDVMVMCLDGEGNWTDTNVLNFTQEGTVVQWNSSQHGTCAFFPAS